MNGLLRRAAPIIVGALLGVAALAAAWCLFPSLQLAQQLLPDISQERLDRASGPLGRDVTVGQTFVSRQAGLSMVEILLVVYDQSRVLPDDARISLTISRQDGESLVTTSMPVVGRQHNERLAFAFPPLTDSQGARYTMSLSTPEDYGLGCWMTLSDAYAEGSALRNGVALPGDLYFATHYTYTLGRALADVVVEELHGLRVLPALAALLLLPGSVALQFVWPRERVLSMGMRVALTVGLSLACWPLALLWCTSVGLRLGGSRVWLVVSALALVCLWRTCSKRRRGTWVRRRSALRASDRAASAAWLVVLAGVVATRILQARGLIVPPWVDSLHHTVVTQLIADSGQVPTDGAPFLQLANFHYHFGFQTMAALLMGLSGLAAHQAVLVMGQVLNVSAVLTASIAAAAVTRRRWSGVVAALVAGLVSNLPAYYLSWGRFTQLAGMVILPGACVAIWRLLREERVSPGSTALVGILIAGLFVVHYRVLVLFLVILPVVGAFTLIEESFRWRVVCRVVGRLGAVAGIALLLTLPWAWRLAMQVVPAVGELYAGWAAPAGYNAFPAGLLNVGWTRGLLAAAGVGAVWAIVRRRWEVVAWALWAGLWYVAANLHLVGLPDLWLLNTSAVFIALWLPVSVLVGWLVVDASALCVGKLSRVRALRRVPWSTLAASAGLVLTVATTVWFGWRMVEVVNPITVLLFDEDMEAITWARDNLPDDALVLVNSRLWDGDIHVGTDGGWWLQLLAARRTTMPSILYHQGLPDYRESVNSLATLVEQAPSVDDPALLARLRDEGVTHVFVGVRAGRLQPNELDASTNYRAVLVHGATRIYAFEPLTP